MKCNYELSVPCNRKNFKQASTRVAKLSVHGIITSLIRFNSTPSVSVEFSDLIPPCCFNFIVQLSVNSKKRKANDVMIIAIESPLISFVIDVPWNICTIIECIDEVNQPIGLFNKSNLALSHIVLFIVI